ncbi:transposase family protein [Sphingomonas donggukensis]|uniref:Transposase family protein n=1 Tax=Sphingomonas donggukensis TaxID=2949093 RepID=A0ABY4TRP1_9SPHN|nr:transposase family protein [Sphingomonas donggukensis]URW75059.1 transposase family protein [Sphingomonas donggukensis]
MSYNKFAPGTLIYIDGAEFRAEGYSKGRIGLINTVTGASYLCRDKDGEFGLLTDDEFDSLLEGGRLKIVSPRTTDRVRLQNEVSQISLAQASKADPGIEKMIEQCRLLDDLGVPNGDKAILRALAKRWDAEMIAKHGPHDPPRTIRYWRSKRGRPGNRHPRDMVRLNRVAVARRSPNNANRQVLWKHAIEGWTVKALPKHVHASYAAEIRQINEGRHPLFPKPEEPYKTVSQRTVRRAYDWLESSATVATKDGKAAVEQDWRGAGRSLTADFAFHRVIIDHTRLNAFAVDDEFEIVLGRPWLTLAIDVRTRAIVASLISFTSPCSWTVGEILRRMALPKRPPSEMAERYPVLRKIRGKPTEIVVDNAAEFRSHTMEAAARGAGIGVRFCPIKAPRYRAVGERAMGTINREICGLLPGRVLPPHDARRFSHNPEDEACVLMRDLEAVANMAIAIYHTEPHSGIGDRQPALMIEHEMNRHGITNFADLDSFRIDTMKIAEDAQVTPSGIRAFGMRYHNILAVPSLLDDLVPLEGRRQRRDDSTATVDFRYDPMDIGRIHVWNRRSRKFVELTCSDERYADGMPEWFHMQIGAKAKQDKEAFNTEDERLAARSRMIQAIRDISLTAKKKSRENLARLLEIRHHREIVGNIVELSTIEPEPVSIDEFIACDRAALTSLDQEILSSRPVARERKSHANMRGRHAEREARDPRDAGQPRPEPTPPEPGQARRRPRVKAARGGFE